MDIKIKRIDSEPPPDGVEWIDLMPPKTTQEAMSEFCEFCGCALSFTENRHAADCPWLMPWMTHPSRIRHYGSDRADIAIGAITVRVVAATLVTFAVLAWWAKIAYSNLGATPQRLLVDHWLEYLIGVLFIFAAIRAVDIRKL